MFPLLRPRPRFACDGGRNNAKESEFRRQESVGESVLSWYELYVDLLRRLRDFYAQLWKDACPGRIVSAVTNALAVAFAATATGAYGEAERHAACVKAWAGCIRADAASLLRANALRMQGSDKRAESMLRDESVVLAALKAAQFQGVMLEGTVLQDALGGVGSLGRISAAELQALVEACWQLQ